MDTETVSIAVLSVTPVDSRTIYALVDVELLLAGVSIVIRGITASHVKSGGTVLSLPRHRAPSGDWRPSVKLPDELRSSLTDIILQHMIDLGVSQVESRPALAYLFPSRN